MGARAMAEGIAQKLRDLTGGSSQQGRSGNGGAGAVFEALTKALNGLSQWASEYDARYGFRLDREVTQAFTLLRAKVERAAALVPQLLLERQLGAGGGVPAGGDGKAVLDQLKAVAELGMQAAQAAGSSQIQQANRDVMLAVNEMINSGAASGGSGSISAASVGGSAATGGDAVLAEMEPAVSAAEALAVCLTKQVTLQAAFTMQLAAAAAGDTVAADRVAQLTKDASDIVQRQLDEMQALVMPSGSSSTAVATLQWSTVQGEAEREAAAAKRAADDAEAAVGSSEEMVIKLQGVVERLRSDVRDVAREATVLGEAAVVLRAAAERSMQVSLLQVRPVWWHCDWAGLGGLWGLGNPPSRSVFQYGTC